MMVLSCALAYFAALLVFVAARSGNPVEANVRDDDIIRLVDEMRRMDDNGTDSRRGIQVDLQGHTTSRGNNDAASRKLFKEVDPRILRGKTYEALISMFDNYNPQTGVREINTRSEDHEINVFLHTIMSTGIMRKVQSFLAAKGFTAARSDSTFRQFLRVVWFDNYSRRRGKADTSGFEHVFIGEWKDGVQGLHNWVRFYYLEKAGKIDYKGFILKRQNRYRFPLFVMVRYNWEARKKPSATFFIGTSPEFDFALSTLCFVAKPGFNKCKFDIDGQKFSMTTHDIVQNGRVKLGSAYSSPRRR